MNESAKIDVAVAGGGIAGLWLLDALIREGYTAALFEAGELGGGQTNHAQGIIHSGAKYALSGKKTKNQRLLAKMPGHWLGAMEGHNPPDLSAARVASQDQYLAIPRGIMSVAASIAARTVLASVFSPLPRHRWPDSIAESGFRGALIRLAEPVFDVPSVVAAFAANHGPRIRQLTIDDATWSWDAARERHRIALGDGIVEARWMIATAGGGNGPLATLTQTAAAAQERPLHMVLLKGDLPAIYLHADVRKARPGMTISSHRAPDGGMVWYIGGDIAEVGVPMSETGVLTEAVRRIGRFFPSLPLRDIRGAARRISRHEAGTRDTRIPEGPVIRTGGVPNSLIAWPTKLAYAPMLAEAVVAALDGPSDRPAPDLPGTPPPVGRPPWETVEWQALP